jgi:hypothetical protein
MSRHVTDDGRVIVRIAPPRGGAPVPVPSDTPNGGPMRILFINNQGGGFADHVEVPDGTTVAALFARQMPAGSDAADYLIRVDRLPAAADQVLHPDARVSFTPVKIDGAVNARC